MSDQVKEIEVTVKISEQEGGDINMSYNFTDKTLPVVVQEALVIELNKGVESFITKMIKGAGEKQDEEPKDEAA